MIWQSRKDKRAIKLYIKKAVKLYPPEEVLKKVMAAGWKQEDMVEMIEQINPGSFPVINEVADKTPPVQTIQTTPKIIREGGQPLGLSSRIAEIESKLEPKKKDKMLKLGYFKESKLKTAAVKDKLLVFLLTNNRGIKTTIEKVHNGFVNVNGVPRDCSADFVFLWKGKYPAVIIPEWDINCIGPKDYYDAIDNGRSSKATETIINMLKADQILNKGGIGSKWIIWLLLGAAVVGYIIFGGK